MKLTGERLCEWYGPTVETAKDLLMGPAGFEFARLVLSLRCNSWENAIQAAKQMESETCQAEMVFSQADQQYFENEYHCDTCNGSGKIMPIYTESEICPDCNGTGSTNYK